MKQKYGILLLIMIAVAIAFFYYSGNLISEKISKIKKVDNQIKKQQEILNSAKVLNEQLQEVSKVIMNTMTEKDEFSPEEVNQFVKRLADLADKYKIAVNSLIPKYVDSYGKYFSEQMYTFELDCTYIQLGQFLSDMESYDNILKVKTLEVSPLQSEKNADYDEGLETHYRVTLQLSAYKIVKEV